MSKYISGEERDAREDKLPHWAQSMLTSLRAKLVQERADAQEIRDFIAHRHPGEVDTFADEGFQRDRVPLGKGTQIWFQLPDRKYNQGIRVRVTRAGLLAINGDDSLILSPESGNHVLIGLRPNDPPKAKAQDTP